MDDYFSLYELPVSFHPDAAQVKNKFYELSRRYHPDRFANADAPARAEALSMAALNNGAYKTLTNPDRLMAHILKRNGLLEEEEKYALPPDFLMEMMDLNEAVSESEIDPENENAATMATNSLNEQMELWNDAMKILTDRYDKEGPVKELLLEIKDMYFRRKYLLRIQERIDRFAAR